MTFDQPLPPDLLEEYKLCQQKATDIADNIWKTALILGVGSVAGIITTSGTDAIPNELKPWLSIIVGLFAIGILLAWTRFARRWWSIEQAMFRRMEHIERQSQLRSNLYVGYLDNRIEFTEKAEEATIDRPFLKQELIHDFRNLRANYERRGIRPMTQFIVEINIVAWFAFAMLESASLVPKTPILDGPTILKWTAFGIFALVFIWRLLTHWQKD
ncbi:MAG: hypothetical protein AABZ58_13335 [Chloroflexota bacterium]